MFGTHNLWAFILAGLALNLFPGPDTMYIIGRSVAQGRRAGVLSVLGISSGSLVHTSMVAFGLSALWATSVVAFTVVKTIGACYLIYLGVRMLLDKAQVGEVNLQSEPLNGWKIYRQGLLTNLLNPKVSLFFLAFLPQFVDARHSWGAISYLFLGFVFIFNGTLWCLFVALCSARATELIRRNARYAVWLNKVTGCVFIGLGAKLLRTKIPVATS